MPSKPSQQENGRELASDRELSQLRREIDALDRQILALLNERARHAARIGQIKSENGLAIYSPAREEQVIQNILRANKGPLSETCVRAIFRELMSGSRALQRPTRVAFLGPEHSFSHIAARERFGASAEFLPVATISTVFESVSGQHADFGVVPLENSTDGGIAETLDMFVQMPLQICGEIRLRIHHYLLAACPFNEIRRVCSKPQALSQCRRWLAQHLPHAELIEVSSTAEAARLAQSEPGTAAIASRQAGVHYGLSFVAEKIEDYRNNVTRFAVVGDIEEKRSGNDRTSILFKVPHRPGSLADALAIFKRNKINLTWIESFPLRGSDQQYVFFADLLGHVSQLPVKRALRALERKAEMLHVLGSYPISPIYDE